jgi:hypothetical protein
MQRFVMSLNSQIVTLRTFIRKNDTKALYKIPERRIESGIYLEHDRLK